MIREKFTKEVLLRLNDFAKKQMVYGYFSEFSRIFRMDRDRVERIQNKKIQEIVNHAYNNTIYYKELFDKNKIKPDGIKTKDDLKKIPPLTREILRDNFDILQDKKKIYKRVSKGSSSGSTGQAVFYLHDEYGSSAGTAALYLGWHTAGFRFGHKGLHIWGNPSIVNNVWNKRSSKIKSKLFRMHKYPAYQLTTEGKFDELTEFIQKGKYNFIDGYTNAIFLLADHLEKNNIKLNGIKYVLPTAENLHDYQKSVIEKNIAPVFDGYGCGEINGIAYQNTYNDEYLVIDPHVAVEFDYNRKTDDNSYPLLITDLDNRVMPLIRYENGDLGTPGSGSYTDTPFSKMKSVSGRVSDIIDLPGGGNLVVPSFFGSVLLKKISSIRQYQIERLAKDLLIIKFVVDGELDENDETSIKNALKEYLGDQIKYEIKIVDKITVDKNGKFKLLIDKTK